MKHLLLFLALAVFGGAASAQGGGKPLFASSDVLRIQMTGPFGSIARSRSQDQKAGSLAVAGEAALPVAFAARGLTRRSTDTCQFPPLRVTFSGAPPATSVFAGQKSLKLVTHCRAADSFQQYVLLEYATYRMFNILSPTSFGARLAQIDYVDEKGRTTSRYGFFIEDIDDVAARNGLRDADLPEIFPIDSLVPAKAAEFALFQHMIANHDWSMRAGPSGETCCHNSKPIAPARGVASAVVPVPYDFDFTGLVNAPYATPPDALRLSSVRERLYRGYCSHNREALAAAAKFRSARPQLLAAISGTPGIEQRTVDRATAYLDGFFADIADDETVQRKVLKTCL